MVNILETIYQEPLWNGHLHIAMAPTKNMDRTEWFAEKATVPGHRLLASEHGRILSACDPVPVGTVPLDATQRGVVPVRSGGGDLRSSRGPAPPGRSGRARRPPARPRVRLSG